MAKLPKKDINLYPLVVAPKKNTMKKGALFGILGTVAVLLLGGSYAGARIYVHTQENLVSEMETKANDTALMEKINNANAVANDIKKLTNLHGEITVPGDKSISHRAVMLGSLAEGTTEVTNFLKGADCISTIRAFQAMGIDIEEKEDTQIGRAHV